jgi:hypothetical protein
MIEKVILECPFCHDKNIEAIHIPKQIKERKGTWGGRPGKRTVPERYEIQSRCSKCGKTQKEIQKALKEGVKDIEKEKKILERLKKQGLLKGEIMTKL